MTAPHGYWSKAPSLGKAVVTHRRSIADLGSGGTGVGLSALGYHTHSVEAPAPGARTIQRFRAEVAPGELIEGPEKFSLHLNDTVRASMKSLATTGGVVGEHRTW